MPVSQKEKKTRRQPAITASMFFKYLACPHWLYFDRFGDPKKKLKLSKFAEMLLDMGLLHEEKIMKDLPHVEVIGRPNAAQFRKTLALMRQGAERIHQGVLMADGRVGRPDILEKHTDQSSDLGPYYYIAVDIKSAEKITDAHRFQLVFYGELLRKAQGVRPEQGYILNASGARIGFYLRESEFHFHEALADIAEILSGKLPAPHLSSGCKQSPWFKECIALAEKNRDIALLYNVKKKVVLALREAGVRTLPDAASIDPDSLIKLSPLFTKKTLERIRLQARALLEGKHFIRKPAALPESAVEIFFDIEGDPLRQVEYLFGFLVRQNGRERYIYFLAEKPEQEEKMWLEFLEWLKTLPDDYAVYHYGTYEKSRLTVLEKAYVGSKPLDQFRAAMIDVNEVVKGCVVFPLYFYGIKDIGGYIGFERKGKIAGGGESVAFYEKWLEKKNPRTLNAILKYNEDDVVATRYLKDWLEKAER